MKHETPEQYREYLQREIDHQAKLGDAHGRTVTVAVPHLRLLLAEAAQLEQLRAAVLQYWTAMKVARWTYDQIGAEYGYEAADACRLVGCLVEEHENG